LNKASFLALCCGVAMIACATPAAAVELVDFSREIRPILSRNCFVCHGPDAKKHAAGLRLDVRESAVAPRGDRQAIFPGDPKRSELVRRVSSDDDDERMPPPSTDKRLNDREIVLLSRWIGQGASYAPH